MPSLYLVYRIRSQATTFTIADRDHPREQIRATPFIRVFLPVIVAFPVANSQRQYGPPSSIMTAREYSRVFA